MANLTQPTGSLNLLYFTTANRIMLTALYRLASHPAIAHPFIRDKDGNPIYPRRFRSFAGIELKTPNELCISISPYARSGATEASALTVGSNNAGTRFTQHTLGGGLDPNDSSQADRDAKIEVKRTFLIELSYLSYDVREREDTKMIPGQKVIFEHDYVEWLLYNYAEYLAGIMDDRRFRYLKDYLRPNSYLLARSQVTRIDYPTSRWETDGNLVLHKVTMQWETMNYRPVNMFLDPQFVPAPEDERGNIILGQIPGPVHVTYSGFERKFFNFESQAEIPREALTDPGTGQPYATLDPVLMSLIDEAPATEFAFSNFFKQVGGLSSC